MLQMYVLIMNKYNICRIRLIVLSFVCIHQQTLIVIIDLHLYIFQLIVRIYTCIYVFNINVLFLDTDTNESSSITNQPIINENDDDEDVPETRPIASNSIDQQSIISSNNG
jgi:hypothetical protein